MFITEDSPEAEEMNETDGKKKKKSVVADEFHYGDKNFYKYPAVGSKNRMKLDSTLAEESKAQNENSSIGMISLSYFN